VDLALPRDPCDRILDPFCIRSGVGKVLAIDAASVVQKHSDRDQFSGNSIGDPKVREVALERLRQINTAFIDQLHDQGCRQHLGDRANVHHGLGRDAHASGDIGDAGSRDLPLAAAEHCGAPARHVVLPDRRVE
jgi:hypothetical protein